MAVVTLLAAIAYPSYRDQVQKGRRSDAMAALGALQLAQERHRSTSSTYAASPQALGRPAVSEGGHYDLSVPNAAGSSYILLAAARADSPQARDMQCAQMAIEYSAGTTWYLAGGPETSLSVDSTRRCWPR